MLRALSSRPTGYFVEGEAASRARSRATRSFALAIAVAVVAVFVLLHLPLNSAADALLLLATRSNAFVGGILALLVAAETWDASSV